MATQKILVTYNFTSYDQKALDFVTRTFAHLKDVEVTLLNLYTPVTKIESRESPVMAKFQRNLDYLSQKVKEQEEGLKEARQYLVQNGFTENQVSYLYKPRKKDIVGEIVDIATKDNFNIVVMNRKPGKVTRFFTGSVFNKVVSALKDKTVCIVS
jgi:nucleotide-binding universal stress UspA family protein